MLDDFEEIGSTAAFLDELDEEEQTPSKQRKRSKRKTGGKGFLGMSPIQWFVISLELFLIVAIMGSFFMILTGKMVLPL
jgi:hypothetical protein